MSGDLFKNLDGGAREAIVLAQREAQALNHAELGAGHVLLGLLVTNNSGSARALRDAGVTIESLRTALSALSLREHDTGAPGGLADEFTFVLASVVGEAPTTPDALCAALLAEENSATVALRSLAVDARVILESLNRTPSGGREPSRASLRSRLEQGFEQAEVAAARVDRVADEGDVAVALLSDRDSPLARALEQLGIYREQLEEALADARGPSQSSGT
jgi:ATP-dependent Clp protease ATP-binding subunit ClpA